jgi:hypothetical protein
LGNSKNESADGGDEMIIIDLEVCLQQAAADCQAARQRCRAVLAEVAACNSAHSAPDLS